MELRGVIYGLLILPLIFVCVLLPLQLESVALFALIYIPIALLIYAVVKNPPTRHRRRATFNWGRFTEQLLNPLDFRFPIGQEDPGPSQAEIDHIHARREPVE